MPVLQHPQHRLQAHSSVVRYNRRVTGLPQGVHSVVRPEELQLEAHPPLALALALVKAIP